MADRRFGMEVMTRMAMAILAVFVGTLSLPATRVEAQPSPSGVRAAQPSATDISAQRRRPLKRIRIYPRYQGEPDDVYPRYFPGSNAVRDCTATYVQEYRPSGTVIVPRMNCYWRRG